MTGRSTELVALAYALVDEHPPREALKLWFTQLAAYARVKFGVIAAVEASVWQDIGGAPTMGNARHRARRLVGGPVVRPERCARDVDSRDVILLSWFLAHVERRRMGAAHPTPARRVARRSGGSLIDRASGR